VILLFVQLKLHRERNNKYVTTPFKSCYTVAANAAPFQRRNVGQLWATLKELLFHRAITISLTFHLRDCDRPMKEQLL
jgi:hypothetical protein